MHTTNLNCAKKGVSNINSVLWAGKQRFRFLTEFHGLGDMPNEFQRVIDSCLKNIPFKNCFIDDILVTSKGSLEEHKAIVIKILTILDKNNMAVK